MSSEPRAATSDSIGFGPSPTPAGAAGELPVIAPETYAIGPELGRGGLGRIRRAFDRRMGRTVAIKELIPRDHANPEATVRFVREALVTGRLEHPSIVPVHEAGRWPNGEPFYAMKLLSGQSLLALIRSTPELADRLSLLPNVIAVAEAIAYAHSKGVIHRDIKPANVIVGQFGETVVIDWGLAKDLHPSVNPDAAPTLREEAPGSIAPVLVGAPLSRASISTADATVAGKVLGTPAYMAPEQAKGETVDERADIYALGALLYHVLAGVSPFTRDAATRSSGETDTKTSSLRREHPDPVPLERRQAGIPTDLRTIVRKAMAADPADRYPSAKQLAADLKRFQTGQLVSAHSYTAWALVRRWMRRYRALVAVATIAVVALAGIAALSVSRIVRARAVAEAQRHEAQRRGAEAEARANELILLQAQAALATDPTAALAWLKLYPATAPRWPRARAIATDASARGVARFVFRGHRGSIHSLAFSPDGTTVASGGTDKTVRLWRLDGGPATVIPVAGSVDNLAFSPDGTELMATSDALLMAWTLAPTPLGPRVVGVHDAPIANLAFSSDGRTLATVGMDRTVRLWDLAGGGARIWRGDSASWGVAFTRGGATLATGGGDHELRLWNVASGTSFAVRNPEPFGPISAGPDQRTVALAGSSGVHLWTVGADAASYAALPSQSEYVINLAFAPDGRQLATGNAGGAVRLWNLATRQAHTLLGHQGHVIGVAYSSDGGWLATAGADGTVRVWAVNEVGDRGRWLDGGERATTKPAISIDGQRFAVGDLDGHVVTWSADGTRRRRWRAASTKVSSLGFLPDGRLATVADDAVRLWDGDGGSRVLTTAPTAPDMLAVSSRGDILFQPPSHDALTVVDSGGRLRCRFAGQGIWTAIFSPDGARVAYVHGEEIRLGELTPGCPSRALYRHGPGIISLAFSPDGRYLASGVDARVGLWDAVSGAVAMLDGHQQVVTEVAFSPDGKTLASGSVDRTIRLWDVATHSTRRVLTGHERAVRALQFVDPRRLASTGLDGIVRVWDLAGDDVRALRGGEELTVGMAASPDGTWLVTSSRQGTVRWSLTAGDLPLDAHGPRGLGAWLSTATTAVIDDRLGSSASATR